MAFRKDPQTGKKVALGAALAGVAGYFAGILTAPKSGKQTREELGEKAVAAKEGADVQLTIAHKELGEAIKKAKTQTVALGAKARNEFDEAVVKARDAQDKAAAVLKAVKRGEADDPQLNKAVKQARQATKNLLKYLNS